VFASASRNVMPRNSGVSNVRRAISNSCSLSGIGPDDRTHVRASARFARDGCTRNRRMRAIRPGIVTVKGSQPFYVESFAHGRTSEGKVTDAVHLHDLRD